MEDLTCCELPCHYPREANKQTKSRESSPCTAPLIQRSLLVKKWAKWNVCFSLISAIWNKVSEQTGFISLLCYYPRNWLKTSKNSILDGFCCYQDVWKKSLYVPKLWTLCEYLVFWKAQVPDLCTSGVVGKTNTASSSFFVSRSYLLTPAGRGSLLLYEWACHHLAPSSRTPYNGPSLTPVSSWRTPPSCHLLPGSCPLHFDPKKGTWWMDTQRVIPVMPGVLFVWHILGSRIWRPLKSLDGF